MKNAKHIVKTVLFCGTLAVFSAVSVFSPKEKGSFYENRRLAVFPVPSVETVLYGTFFSDVETYISDHFACRVPLLRLNVRKELALHNPVVSNTVIAGDTLLPYHGKPRTDYDHENMQTVLDALSQVSAACETVGAKFVYLSIPEQSSALRYKYPSYLTSGTYTDDSMRTDFLAGLDARGIDCLNMAEYLCTYPEKYYSKTDHHYNFYGAYETYLRTMEHLQTLGIDAPVTTDVTIEPIERPFLGSRSRKLLGEYPTDDKRTALRLARLCPSSARIMASRLPTRWSTRISTTCMITTWVATLAKPLLRQTVPACRVCSSSAIRSPTPWRASCIPRATKCAAWITATMTARIFLIISLIINLMSCCMSAMI